MTTEEQVAFDKVSHDLSVAKEENAKLKDENTKLKAQVPAPVPVVIVKPGAFKFSGRIGGPFSIDGAHFGSSGTVTIAGRNIDPLRWKDRIIKGTVPPDLKPGLVEIVVNGTTVKYPLT